MLTLAGAVQLGDVTAYRDLPPGAVPPAFGDRFYVLPDAPRLAVDADGVPEFDFVFFRGPPTCPGSPTSCVPSSPQITW